MKNQILWGIGWFFKNDPDQTRLGEPLYRLETAFEEIESLNNNLPEVAHYLVPENVRLEVFNEQGEKVFEQLVGGDEIYKFETLNRILHFPHADYLLLGSGLVGRTDEGLLRCQLIVKEL